MTAAPSRRRTAFRFAAALLGLLGAVLLIEGVVHVAWWWTARPLHGATTRDVAGLSGGIVAVGDSWTFGIGAEEGASWPAQLAALLAREPLAGGGTVVNLGIPGANSTEAMAPVLSAWAMGARPAWVVAAVGANNVWSFRHASFWTDFLPDEVPLTILDRLAARTGIGRLLAIARSGGAPWPTEIVGPTDDTYTPAIDLVAGGPALLSSEVRAERDFIERWLAHDFAQLCSAADEHGARLAVLSYHFTRAGIRAAQRAAVEACPGAVFIDAFAFGNPIGGLPGRAFLSADGWHPNARGYARVAGIVANALREAEAGSGAR